MKALLASIRTCPPALTAISLGSLLLLLVKTIWLNQVRAPHALAPSLGLLVEGFLSATVAAYVFFVVSVQLPQVLELRRFGVFIVGRVEAIANSVMGFLQMIAGTTGAGILDRRMVDLNTVRDLFSRVSPNGSAPMVTDWRSPPLSWLAAMARHDEWRIDQTDRLLQLGRFVDSELLGLINAIDDSAHAAAMRDVRKILTNAQLQNPDLQAWAENYYDSYQIARRLTDYCEKFRSIYGVQS